MKKKTLPAPDGAESHRIEVGNGTTVTIQITSQGNSNNHIQDAHVLHPAFQGLDLSPDAVRLLGTMEEIKEKLDEKRQNGVPLELPAPRFIEATVIPIGESAPVFKRTDLDVKGNGLHVYLSILEADTLLINWSAPGRVFSAHLETVDRQIVWSKAQVGGRIVKIPLKELEEHFGKALRAVVYATDTQEYRLVGDLWFDMPHPPEVPKGFQEEELPSRWERPSEKFTQPGSVPTSVWFMAAALLILLFLCWRVSKM